MTIRFTDLHIDTLARGLFTAGEELLQCAVGIRKPWYGPGLFKRTVLLLATNQRLILVTHKAGIFGERLDQIDSLTWRNISLVMFNGTGLEGTLSIFSGNQQFTFTIRGGFFQDVKGNLAAARSIAQQWGLNQTGHPHPRLTGEAA